MPSRDPRPAPETDDAPQEDPAGDPHPWRLVVLLTLLTIGLGMVVSLWLMPLVLHYHGWEAPEDAWPSLVAARYVSWGALGYVYSSNVFYVVTPLLALLLAPVALVGDLFPKLVYNWPYQIPHPWIWLVYGPYGFALCAPIFWTARKLAYQVGLEARAALIQWGTLVMAVIPMAVLYGHFEDVLALACVMLAMTLVFREKWPQAALAFGFAIAFKQWALLGLPLLVAIAPRDQRVRMAVRSLIVPAALVVLPLVQDWHDASRALFAAKSYPHGIEHSALWLRDPGAIVAGTPGRSVALVFAVVLAWWLRDRDELPLILGAFGVVFLSRLLFEPRILFYYLGPGLMFLWLHERLTTGHWWRVPAAGCLFMAYFHLHLRPVLWWPAAFVFIGILIWPAARDVLRRTTSPEPETEAAPLLAA
jgi:hypothetical protein